MIEIILTQAAFKDLAKLDKTAGKKAQVALARLASNPKMGHGLEGSLKGACALGFKVIGVEYRIAYVIDSGACLVFAIGSHENFYKLAARRVVQVKRR